MNLKRNVFHTFALMVFLACILLAISFTLNRMGDGQEYPYLLKGLWIIGMGIGLCLFLVAGTLYMRAGVSAGEMIRRKAGHLPVAPVAEGIIAFCLTGAGVFLRIMVIQDLPMTPDSDYKTFFGIAQMLTEGRLLTDGPGYCDYVAMFPHVFGFPAFLSRAFSLFGVSVNTALMFNLVMETGCCVLVWQIARLTAGRLAGLAALGAVCFLPSVILYGTFVASEPLFTFFLLLGILFFTISLKESKRKEHHPWLCIIELVLCGVALALGSYIRPMALIFLVAAVICMLGGDKPLPALPRNDIPLGLRASNKGWKRCIILAASYFLMSNLLTIGAGYAVDRHLAGGTASFGYNLMVGLNLESYGGWNQEDSDYLNNALAMTGSAEEAQLACRDIAMQRLQTDPRALLNLFIHKFEVLWGNDDYGASWNILFLDQQGNLTRGRESLLYQMMDVSNLYYVSLLFLSGLSAVFMLRRKPDAGYACVLLFCGTAALHLLVENQNRYHYHALFILAILSGLSVRYLMELLRERVLFRKVEAEKKARVECESREHRENILHEQEDINKMRSEALHAQFDMGSAIREGHIHIVMSEAAARDAAWQSAAESEAGRPARSGEGKPEGISETLKPVPEEETKDRKIMTDPEEMTNSEGADELPETKTVDPAKAYDTDAAGKKEKKKTRRWDEPDKDKDKKDDKKKKGKKDKDVKDKKKKEKEKEKDHAV